MARIAAVWAALLLITATLVALRAFQRPLEYNCYLTRPPRWQAPEVQMDCTIDGARVVMTLQAEHLVKAPETIDTIKRMVADVITAYTTEDLSDEAHFRRHLPAVPAPQPAPAPAPAPAPTPPPAPPPAPPPTPQFQADCTDASARAWCQKQPGCVCVSGQK